MPRRFPLQPLLDLAKNHTDAAARNLHTLKVAWQGAEEKLRQLIAYREDYRARLLQATKMGMQANSLKDFQLFLGKLEIAIRQQAEEVARCKKCWEDGRHEWQAKQRKLKAFDTLSQRHQNSERKREDKIEQREQDELSGKKFEQREPKDSTHS
ncbi:MAG TPA: flagellar export protein FliJ [Sulfuricella sp.]|nr:flagellar export protein FliJ [Sulfuricella sp.]